MNNNFKKEFEEFRKYNNTIIKKIINKNFLLNQSKINIEKNLKESKKNLNLIRRLYNE